MSETRQESNYTHEGPYRGPGRLREPTAWVGLVVYAGTMLVLVGGIQAIEGLVAVFRDDYYATTRSGLVLTFDYTVWGWIHLLLGAIAVAAGVGVFAGRMWARVIGIIVAALSAVANMMFLPAYPVWCVILIGTDVLVIYALAMHGREVRFR